MISYWNETLENLIQDQRNDKFKLIVNNCIYPVPLSFAIGLSPLITEKYLQDPTYHELNIKLNNSNSALSDDEIQNEFSNFIKGEKISKNLFYEIGIILKNKDMIKKWKKSQELSKEVCIQFIIGNRKLLNKNINEIENIQEELGYIEEHIEEMTEEIKELSDEELIFILKNSNLKVKNEDVIWKIVKERIENSNQNTVQNKEKKKNRSLLIGTIHAQNLNKNSFKEYIEVIEKDDIEREDIILMNIKKLLLKNIETIEFEENRKEKIIQIDHQMNNNFNGIISYLKKKHGNNIHDQGIISIEASSTDYYSGKPELVIDYNLTGCKWWSEDIPGSWLEINFKKYKVKINGYSLKACSGNPNTCYHLRNWVIEGSTDRTNWVEIDKRINNTDLNGRDHQQYYSVTSKPIDEFQFIRIKSIGKNNGGPPTDHLHFTNIEFYGQIINNFE